MWDSASLTKAIFKEDRVIKISATAGVSNRMTSKD